MNNQYSLANFGDLSKPANTLIERISDAVGVIYEPTRIIKKAEAETKAEQIKTISKIETTKLQFRAIKRFIQEEGIKQGIFEKIILNSLPLILPNAKPENISNEWLLNFSDKAKLPSDNEVQKLWSQILAGEANNPGKYSKRTIDLVSSFDKKDIAYFNNLSNFSFDIGLITLLIFDDTSEIYLKNGLNFTVLTHLDTIGLITFDALAGFTRRYSNLQSISVNYMGKTINLIFSDPKLTSLNIGKALLTQSGLELFSLCVTKEVSGFKEFVTSKWTSDGIKII